MATFYLDLEGGNDANDGLSFANRWKTFASGATAARIAPGDTIRVMASPNPTSVGSATWTNGPRGANVAISSSTNASPIVITTSAAHGLVAGDYVTITGHTTNTNANGVWKVGTVGSSTTFQILEIDGTNTTGNGIGGAAGNANKATNCIVKLASPVTQNIALCGGLADKPAWTASANVTATQNTTAWKEGYSSASIAITAAFTTGLAAYYTLPATLNLSGYQQVSFWIQQTAGTLGAASAVYVALCSDTVGATVVNTINVPVIGALTAWQQVTVDLGANLGSSIRSVAFYVATDNGAQTFLLDNIIACKASSSADSLTLSSLISKSDGTGDEAWYPIQSINYDAVMLANANNQLPTAASVRGYMGTTETVTTYKRETIKTTPVASTVTVNTFTESGTAANLTTYSGGWNRTDMSTQTGETWCDGQNGNGYCYSGNTIGFVRCDKLNAVRYNNGFRSTPTTIGIGNQVGYGRFTGCTIGITNSAGTNALYETVWVNNNGTGISLAGTSGTVINTVVNGSNCTTTAVTFGEAATTVGAITQAHNCNTSGITFGTTVNVAIGSLVSNYNTSNGISASTAINISIGGGSTTGNVTAGITAASPASVVFNDFTFNEPTEVSIATSSNGGVNVWSTRNDATAGNSWGWVAGGTINQQNSVVDSPATTAWKLSPTSTVLTNQGVPLKLKLGTVVCGASALVTVTARMRRDNSGLTMQLVCPGGQIAGVSSDVTSSVSSTGAWETVTITFTPTVAGGVDIYAYAYGGSTFNGYVCNLTASQA